MHFGRVLRQAGVLVAIAAAVALGVYVVMWARTPHYTMLYSDLSDRDLLFRIATELGDIRRLVQQAVYNMGNAEKEIPEWMRRFGNYMHDIVHIREAYTQLGLAVPAWLDEEIERCHDRMSQSLHDLHVDGGAFEKVRREMTTHPIKPKYDHTRQLSAPKNGAST